MAFGKKQDKPSRGFLKSGTAGSSNEVSFSVMDAKLGPQGRGSNADKLGKLQVESSDALRKRARNKTTGQHSAHAGGNQASEIAHRKTQRLTMRFVAIISALIVCFVAVTYVTTFLNTNSQTHQTQVARLQIALNDIIEVDNTLVKMDTALSNPIDMSSFEDLTELSEESGTLNTKLNEAERIINSVVGVMSQSTDRTAGEKALEAIEARRIMLSKGIVIIEQAQQAAQSVELVMNAWEQVYEADTYVKACAEELAKTDADVNTAYDSIENAVHKLSAAQSQINASAELYPLADMSIQKEYVEKRLESAKHAQAACEALIAQDPQTAQSELALCNESERDAAELVSQLPAYPSEAITSYYMQSTADAVSAYEEARTKAANADSFLRNYLGK